MNRRDFFAIAAASSGLQSESISGATLGRLSAQREIADIPEDELHTIEVGGGTVKLFNIRATLAEGRPYGQWRRLRITGLIGTGIDGYTYWQENAESIWVRCNVPRIGAKA